MYSYRKRNFKFCKKYREPKKLFAINYKMRTASLHFFIDEIFLRHRVFS